MPTNVTIAQIVRLVQITNDYAPCCALSRLADKLQADTATLSPIIEAAEMLGLVERQKDEFTLTDLGLKFQEITGNLNKIRLVKDELAKIEPFKTSLELANQRSAISAADVAETLKKKGVRWDQGPELSESLVNHLLIPWAILTSILEYDGKTEKFRKPSEPSTK
jgi:hypothetical protein